MKEKIYFILSMIIFGGVGVFAKYINLSSREIALLLSLIGGLCLLVVFVWRKQKVSWRKVKKNAAALFIASVALSGNWIFLFQAYKETTIANAALSYYFAPVLVIILSPFVLKEKLSPKKAVCVGIALLGLFFVLQNGELETTGHHLPGIGYGLVAAAFYAVLTLVNKFIRDLDGLENTLLQLGLSVTMLLPFVLFTSGFNIFSITGETVALMLLLGILHGGIGFYLFFAGMKGLQGQSVAVLSYIDPLTSLLISALVVGERMTLQQLIGAALLLGSTWIGEVGGDGQHAFFHRRQRFPKAVPHQLRKCMLCLRKIGKFIFCSGLIGSEWGILRSGGGIRMVRPRNFDEANVLREAMTLFRAKGYEATSLSDLLHATGLSKSSLYETFGSKHDLFIRAFALYRTKRMAGLIDCLNDENVYRGIEASFYGLLDGESSQLGCMTSNEAIELAPHDEQFRMMVESDFDDVEQAYLNAIERGKSNGSLSTDIESLKLARFLTVSLQGINVMVRAQSKRERIEDSISVILEKLN
ncbi:EamA family transporter [Paenibacillus jiagnxiensis]|uniref:EamA family transporter n=1 Tax=Paenibacillus jiagnxiensis TaxID=3228926 RepID=UPI0033B5D6A7